MHLFRTRKIDRFWLLVALLLAAALLPRLLSYRFSLPYIDHPDEPNYYLGALEMRGLFDIGGYFTYAPPLYIYLSVLAQWLTGAAVPQQMAEAVALLRLTSALLSVGAVLCIVLAVRRTTGNALAALLAGVGWAAAPLVLQRDVFALPDPAIYFLSALAIWLLAEALADPDRRANWITGATLAGGLAVGVKAYVPLLGPGVLAALFLLWRAEPTRRRAAWVRLAVQIGLVAAVMLWMLVGVYLPTANTTDNDYGSAQLWGSIQNSARNNLLNPAITLNNLYHAALPLNPFALLILLVAGALAYGVNRRRDGWTASLALPGIIALYALAGSWVVSAYLAVDVAHLRYTLPVTAALAVLGGIALAQVIAALPESRRMWGTAGLVALYALFVLVPQVQQDAAIVADRMRGDRRAEARFWVEQTLDPGWVLVTPENHKTFNNVWSGIPVVKWFDWITTSDLLEQSVTGWREERGVTYALLTATDVDTLAASDAGQAMLDAMLLLRRFDETPDWRGPGLAMYRLWPADHAADALFGPAIHLRGYDLDAAQVPAPGDSLSLTLYWQADAPSASDYSLFLHLAPLDDRQPVAQVDGPPVRPERPTPSWNAPSETLVSQPLTLALPDDLPPGDYRLLIGLYDYISGARLAVTAGEGVIAALPDDSLHLLTLTVGE